MDDIEDVDDDAVFEMTPTRPQRLPDSDPDADSNNGDENQGENARSGDTGGVDSPGKPPSDPVVKSNKAPVTPSSRRAILDRMGAKKAEKDSIRAHGDNEPNQTNDFSQSNERRKELLKRRQLARSGAAKDSSQDTGSKDLGYFSDSEIGTSSSPLTTTHMAVHVYPLRFLPSLRSDQTASHPLLVMPAPHPDIGSALSRCVTNSTSWYTGSSAPVHWGELEWGDHIDSDAVLLRNIRQNDGPSETDRLLGGGSGDKSHNIISASDKFANAADIPVSSRFEAGEGLFVGQRSLLSDLLMSSEEISEGKIASLAASDLYLSRITQRMLRDVCNLETSAATRRMWSDLNGNSTHKNKSDVLPQSSLSNFLRQVNTSTSRGPVFKNLENPVDELLYHAIRDADDASWGGPTGRSDVKHMHDAQFAAGATKGEILGHIPAWSGRRDRNRRRCILNVHIQTINLTMHPLMNDEEKKFVELKKIYSSYRVLFENQATGYLVYRLHALILELQRVTAVDNFDDWDYDGVNSVKVLLADIIETLPSLAELKNGILKLSEKLYTCWTNLKVIRRRQGFISTRAVLLARPIHQATAMDNDEKLVEPDSNNDDLYPQLDAEISHWRDMNKYLGTVPSAVSTISRKLKEFEQKKRDSAGSSKKMSLVAQDNNDVSEKQKATDEEFDSNVASAVALLNESIKILDGDFLPAVVYRLSSLGQITEGKAEPVTTEGSKKTDALRITAAEEKRRQSISELRVKLVLKANGRILTSTAPIPLHWPSFNAEVLRTFEIRVFRELVSVTVDVYICYPTFFGTRDELLANVAVPLPTLSGQELGTQNVAPVASWCFFNSIVNPVITTDESTAGITLPRLEGSLLCGSEYEVFSEDFQASKLHGVKTQHISHFGRSSTALVGSKTTASGIIGGKSDFTRERDFQKLLPDLDGLDPNDPQNDQLLRLKRIFNSGNQTERDSFVLIGGSRSLMSYGEGDASYSNFLRTKPPNRISLLMMRQVKPYLFTEPIPLSEALIKKSEFYRNLLSNDGESNDKILIGAADPSADGGKIAGTQEEDEDEDEAAEGVGIPMQKISSFLQRVRDSHTAVSNKSKQKRVSTASVVMEPIKLNDPLALESPMNLDWLQPKRALRPTPKERKPSPNIVSSCNLLIQVIGAKNVPLRLQSEKATAAQAPLPRNQKSRSNRSRFEDDDQDDDADNEHLNTRGRGRARGDSQGGTSLDRQKMQDKMRARTFVEVRFQDSAVRTSTVDGGAPMWKQSLSLPINAPKDDFSPNNIDQINDQIYFTLFDEISQDDKSRGGHFEDESTERIERRFLGSFSVPFSTVFSEGMINGVFRLNTPPFNFGFESSVDRKLNGQSSSDALTSDDPYEGMEARMPTIMETLFGPTKRPAANADTSHSVWGSQIDEETEAEFEYFASGDTSAYLKLMITLDPLLSRVVVAGTELASQSVFPADRPMTSYAQQWLSELHRYSSVTKKRDYTLFGDNSDGYKVLICRYLTPQEPPPMITTRRGCLHFASMIPFMPDSQAFVGEIDLWCTTKQTLEMGAGDEEEHGVSLFNFLSYLQKQSGNSGTDSGRVSINSAGYPSAEYIATETLFFIIGRAVPEGSSCYVLIRKSQPAGAGNRYSPDNYILVNPCTGYIYSASDRDCPFIDIACMATSYNIWANIQNEGKPNKLNYDVLNTKCWKPFFGSRYPFPKLGLLTVQERIEYTPTSSMICVQVEKEVRGSIKSCFRKWRAKRSRSVTTFHPDACSIVSDHLHLLEEWKLTGDIANLEAEPGSGFSNKKPKGTSILSKSKSIRLGSHGIPEHILSLLQTEIKNKLKNVLKKRELYGYPMNIAFTDVKMVVDRVKSLCIHESRHPSVQFVLAVKAFPLVNNMVSLWIFLGTLEESSS